MEIKIKNPISQMFCKHEYHNFKTPINKKTNPLGFIALNDHGIWVCIKCGNKTR